MSVSAPNSAPSDSSVSVSNRTSFQFSRCYRLVHKNDFQRVFDQPVRAGCRYLTMLARPNELGHARMGVIIGKRSAKLAVQRNWFKRTVRDAFRLRRESLSNWDYLIIAKPGIAKQEREQVRQWLDQSWQRLQRQGALRVQGAQNS
ncbi:MAG: ribonuclease P protein component [Gammaproteobacteria bacterium]|nr:ribonuclease P protein component [Gammaproteobacteria bacterium]PCH61983.1 MAG: ribonuclease P protein component [Gammaproteobacteria bacterium]